MKNYHIGYELDGEVHTTNMTATTPGQAQAKLLANKPGAKVTRCLWEGHLAGKIDMPMVCIEYETVSAVRVTPLESEGAREQVTFGFLDSIKPVKRKR